MKITINEIEYDVKYSFRAHMVYENSTNKTYPNNTITDLIIFFYCCLLASNKDISLSMDEFIDYLDENPDKLTEFSNLLIAKNEKVKAMSPKETTDKKEKKTNQK